MVLVATQVKRRRGTTAENDAFTGAEGEITVDTEKHELRVHDGVTQGGFKIGGGSGAMPVGAIFTTPRTGTIQGAVEANGSPYNIADYSGEGSIGALLTAGSIAYVSKAEFQTQVTNTGACDSFGWDGATDTTFLVPKLNPWHVGKNAPVVGNGNNIGWTDGTTEYAGVGQTYQGVGITGIFGTDETKTLPASGTGKGYEPSNNKMYGLSTDPTKSGVIADLSETTNLRVMVQLATGATDQALETCTSVLADVAGLNAHRVIEFQAPTAENGYTWYRKYADGWVEQGGINNTDTLTYLIPMAGTNYIMFLQPMETTGKYAMNCNNLTTTGASINTESSQWHEYSWQISGMSAQ